MTPVAARERIILAIDTSSVADAERLVGVAAAAGAVSVKLGLELSTATSWRHCSELAARHGLEWVADAKLDDIPNTVVGAVRNIVALEHPPSAITMHTTAGSEAMRASQQEAGDTAIYGVTVLTSIKDDEATALFGADARRAVPALAGRAAAAGLRGLVCSPLEVASIKAEPTTRDLFTMIPGTRSASADVQDQSRVATPGSAIRDGADLLVIGRQVTQAQDPAAAYEALLQEIDAASDD